MDTNTEKTTATEKTRMAIYFRYPKTPRDESIVQQRINAMTSAIAKYLSLPRSITSLKSKIWSRSSQTGEFGGSVIPNAGSAGPRKICSATWK